MARHASRFVLLLALTALLGLAACAHQSGGIAASNVPLEPGSYTVLKAVRGTDCQVRLLGLIPVSDGNETQAAIADALKKAPGATALVGVTSDTYSQHWILWSTTCTQALGTAVQSN